jgi:hypothetical protein
MSTEHSIPLAEAAELTKNYRDANPGPGTIKAGKFSKEAIDAVMAPATCVGMRIYYGQEAGGDSTLVLVGVDAAGNDLTTEYIADRMKKDPPYSSNPNALNS